MMLTLPTREGITYMCFLGRTREFAVRLIPPPLESMKKRCHRLYPYAISLIGTRGRVLLKREGLMQESEDADQGSSKAQAKAPVDRTIQRKDPAKTTIDRAKVES